MSQFLDDASFAFDPANPLEARTERLQTVLRGVQNGNPALKDSLKKLQPIIQGLISDPAVDLGLLATQVYGSLVSSFPDTIDEAGMCQIIRNLGDSQPVLRKASHTCLLTVIRTTGSFESILRGFIDAGFESSEWTARQKSINSFQSLFLSEGARLKWESNLLRRAVEVLIDRMLDPNQTVSKAAEQALLSLNSNENFRLIVLPTVNKNKQELLREFIENYKGKVLTSSGGTGPKPITTPIKDIKELSITSNSPKSFAHIGQNLLDKTPEHSNKKSSKHFEELSGGFERLNNNATFLLKSPGPQKIYGIFPLKTVNELLEDKDWQTRSNAIEELEKLTEDIENKSSDFLPHLSDFLKLMTRLLMDSNFKICLTTLNILSRLLVFRELRMKPHAELLYPKLLEKLGDSKIAIRQACARILKELVDRNPGTNWFESLVLGLESPNQHIREESLNLLSFFIGKSQLEPEFCMKLLIIVLRFLEDMKLKVKLAALETLAALSQRIDKEVFQSILRENLTEEGVEMVLAKVQENTQKKGDWEEKKGDEGEKPPSRGIDKPASRIMEKQLVEENKRPIVSPSGFELSTSCSSRSIPYTSSGGGKLDPPRKDEEKRALSAFSLKTSAVSEELDPINEEPLKTYKLPMTTSKPPLNSSTKSPKKPIPIPQNEQAKPEYLPSKINNPNDSFGPSSNPKNNPIETIAITNPTHDPTNLTPPQQQSNNNNCNNNNDFQNILANENNLALLISPFNTLSNMSNPETTQPEPDPQSRKKPKPKQRTLPGGTTLKSASMREKTSDSDLYVSNLTKKSSENDDEKRGKVGQKSSSLREKAIEEDLMIKGKEYSKWSMEEEEEKRSQNKTSNFDTKSASYLDKEELEPLRNPEGSLKALLNDIKAEDWARQFESLNTLRRLNLFHPDVLTSNVGALHSLILELLRLIESLRSSVSKNAMLTTTELLEKLKKGLDVESDLLFSRLMRKGLDSSAFIAEEVRRGLMALASNCSENKVVPLLLGQTQTKAYQAKLNLLICFEAVLKKNAHRLSLLKDHEKLLQALVGFLFDGNNEVRLSAKAIFLNLHAQSLDRNELERILLRVLNDQSYQKVQLILEKEGGFARETAQFTNKKPFSLNATKLKKKSTTPENTRKEPSEAPIELNNFVAGKPPPKVLRNLSNKLKASSVDQEVFSKSLSQAVSNDWKERLEAIKGLNELVERSPEEFLSGKTSNMFLDSFLKLLNDSNAKVSLAALSSFKLRVSQIPQALINSLPNVLSAVFQSLGSFNAGLRTAGLEVLDEIMENVEKGELVAGLANGCVFAVAKSRPLILMRLIDIVPEIQENRPNLVSKHVVPLALKLLEENKAEMKQGLAKLLETMKECLGEEFYSNFPAAKVALINEFLKK